MVGRERSEFEEHIVDRASRVPIALCELPYHTTGCPGAFGQFDAQRLLP